MCIKYVYQSFIAVDPRSYVHKSPTLMLRNPLVSEHQLAGLCIHKHNQAQAVLQGQARRHKPPGNYAGTWSLGPLGVSYC